MLGTTFGSLCLVGCFVEFEAHISLCDAGVWCLSATELLFREAFQKYVALLSLGVLLISMCAETRYNVHNLEYCVSNISLAKQTKCLHQLISGK